MAFGLTSAGFNKAALTDILNQLNTNTQAVFGPVNVAPDSVFGQYNGIIAEAIADVWDLAELVYASQYALSALGVSLDAVAELNNLTRLGATSSSATAIMTGAQATSIPQNTEVRQANTDEIFRTAFSATLDIANVLKVTLSINDVASQPHTVTIQRLGTPDVAVSSSLVSTENNIMIDLRDQINLNGTYLAELNPTNTNQLVICNTSADDIESFGILIGASVDVEEQWTPVTVEAVNTGSLPVPAGSINTIETPIVGLNAVDNLSAGTEGRDVETDDEFRVRRKKSLQVVGAGTIPSIEARLVEEVESVAVATVKDNRNDVTDADGRPPHSFEAIVTFSPDTPANRQLIADKLWEVGPAGIETFGTITEQVTDSAGDLHIVKFSQPTIKYIHINLAITLNAEEVFPTNGEDAIKANLAEFGNSLNTGEDCLRQRFYSAIYAVAGVKDITLFEFAATENPGDTPAVLATETVTGNPETSLYDLSAAQLITDGVITGMVVKDSSGSPLSSVRNLNSETQFRADSDQFSVSDVLEFGGFGEVNIGINANEIARFDVARIALIIN